MSRRGPVLALSAVLLGGPSLAGCADFGISDPAPPGADIHTLALSAVAASKDLEAALDLRADVPHLQRSMSYEPCGLHEDDYTHLSFQILEGARFRLDLDEADVAAVTDYLSAAGWDVDRDAPHHLTITGRGVSAGLSFGPVTDIGAQTQCVTLDRAKGRALSGRRKP